MIAGNVAHSQGKGHLAPGARHSPEAPGRVPQGLVFLIYTCFSLMGRIKLGHLGRFRQVVGAFFGRLLAYKRL